MVKVGDFVKQNNITILYATGRELVNNYKDKEVLAYAISDFGGAFVFKGERKYFAFLNGERKRQISKVVSLITRSEFKKKLPDKDLERYAFLNAI